MCSFLGIDYYIVLVSFNVSIECLDKLVDILMLLVFIEF